MAGQILPNDDHRQAGGGHVLLRAGEDDAVFAYIHRAGENVRGHVAYNGDGPGVGDVLPLGAVDGVVGTVVEVAGVGGQLELLLSGDIAVVAVAGISGDIHGAVLGGLLGGDAGEVAGDRVVSLAVGAHQVQRDHGELAGSTGLQKQDLIAVGHIHQAAQLLLGLVKNLLKDL